LASKPVMPMVARRFTDINGYALSIVLTVDAKDVGSVLAQVIDDVEFGGLDIGA